MQRQILQRPVAHSMMMPGVSDEESLLIQLCEYLHDSGFLFNDATSEEIAEGQAIIQDFFEQEGEFVMQYLSEELLRKFVNYVQEHQWSQEIIEKKLRMKTVRAFDQLSRGASHSWNIPRNIHLGLLQFPQHGLQDFLLYLTAYHQLLLEEEENPEVDASYTVNDLMRLREELVERLEGRKFVELLLSDISRQRGGHLPLEEKKIRRSVQFIRPSQASQTATLPQQPTGIQQPPKPSLLSSSPEQPFQSETTKENKLSNSEFLEEDLEFEEEESSDSEDEASVIYGTGQITREATIDFLKQQTDSALKFLFRRDLTEKPLNLDVIRIHEQWEARGLKRGVIRKHILEVMEWKEIPKNHTILELSGELKDRIYDLLHGNIN